MMERTALRPTTFTHSFTSQVRQFGVVLFKARDFMDSLDGWLARAASHGRRMRMTVETNTLGYYLDGVCDGVADVFLFVALLLYFHR